MPAIKETKKIKPISFDILKPFAFAFECFELYTNREIKEGWDSVMKCKDDRY